MKLRSLVASSVVLLAFGTVASGGLVLVNQESILDQVTLIYDPSTGNLKSDNGGNILIAFELKSPSQILIPANVAPGLILAGFDVNNPGKLFKLFPNGFGNLDWGNVIPTGMNGETLANELLLAGVYLGGGAIDRDGGPNLYVVPVAVPEPNAFVLVALVGCGLFIVRFVRHTSQRC